MVNNVRTQVGLVLGVIVLLLYLYIIYLLIRVSVRAELLLPWAGSIFRNLPRERLKVLRFVRLNRWLHSVRPTCFPGESQDSWEYGKLPPLFTSEATFPERKASHCHYFLPRGIMHCCAFLVTAMKINNVNKNLSQKNEFRFCTVTISFLATRMPLDSLFIRLYNQYAVSIFKLHFYCAQNFEKRRSQLLPALIMKRARKGNFESPHCENKDGSRSFCIHCNTLQLIIDVLLRSSSPSPLTLSHTTFISSSLASIVVLSSPISAVVPSLNPLTTYSVRFILSSLTFGNLSGKCIKNEEGDEWKIRFFGDEFSSGFAWLILRSSGIKSSAISSFQPRDTDRKLRWEFQLRRAVGHRLDLFSRD